MSQQGSEPNPEFRKLESFVINLVSILFRNMICSSLQCCSLTPRPPAPPGATPAPPVGGTKGVVCSGR